MAGAGRCLFLKIFFLRMLSLDWPRPESRLTDCVGGLGFESEPDSCFCLRAAARTCLWSLSEPLENFLFLRNKNRDFCILTIKLPEHTNKLCSMLCRLSNNQLEKLECAKAALLSLTGPYRALQGLTGPYWASLGLNWALGAIHK